MADPVSTELEDQKKPKSLQERVRNVSAGISRESETGSGDEPADLKTSAEYLRELHGLSEDPKFQREAPPDTQQTLQKAISEAKALYQERATRNDWAEVAQMLGRALATWGAASQGGLTAKNPQLDFGQGIDFGAKTDRAHRDYLESVRQAGDTASNTRQHALDEGNVNKEEYGKRYDYLGKALSAARDKEDRAAQERKDAERDKKGGLAETLRINKMTLDQLTQQEKEYQKQLKARTELASQMGQEGDLSDKNYAKLESQYGRLAGAGDINLTELKEELDQQTEPGMLYGTNPSPSKQKDLLKSKVQDIRNLLDSVKQRKQEIINSMNSKEPREVSSEVSAPPPSGGTVKIQAPDGTVAEVPAAKKDYYISKGGKLVQ